MSDEKDLLNEETVDETQKASDIANEEVVEETVEKVEEATEPEVKYEENDNWNFEAEAPTISDDFLKNDEFEVEVKKAPKKEKKEVPSQPQQSKKKDSNLPKFIIGGVLGVIVIALIVVFGVKYYTEPNCTERMNPGNVCLTVGDTKVSIGMYNYYYTCIANNYVTYASYGYYDIDTTVAYDEQTTTDSDGNECTWEDIFDLDTISQIQYITAYYEAALEAGVGLTSDQETTIKENIESLEETAEEAEQTVDEYLQATYGDYCGIATIEKMLEQCYIAENYYQQKQVEIEVTDEELESYISEHQDEYQEISVAYLPVYYDTTYDSAAEEAQTQAEEYITQITSVDDMKALIPEACSLLIDYYVEAEYFEDADECAETLAESLEMDFTYSDCQSYFSDDLTEWMFDDETQVGDMTTYLDEDYGCVYIFLKTGDVSIQDYEVYSVRHILIQPVSTETEDEDEDEDEDGEDTEVEYTDEEWDVALNTATSILESYNSGDQTEYSFALLAEERSDDTESTSSGSSGLYGGLYEGTEIGTMVTEFEEWATDDSRQYGDTGIVKSDYGYHIMYFVEDTEYYKYACKEALISEKETEFVESLEIKEHSRALSKTTQLEPTEETDEE